MIIFNSFFFSFIWNSCRLEPTPHNALCSLFSPSDWTKTSLAVSTVFLLVCTVSRLHDADLGYVLIVDRRSDRWNAVKATLLRLSVCCGAAIVELTLVFCRIYSSTPCHPCPLTFFLLHFVCVCVWNRQNIPRWCGNSLTPPLMHSPHNNGTIFIFSEIILFCSFPVVFLAFLDCY